MQRLGVALVLVLLVGCEAHFGKVGWSLANGFCAEGPMDIKLGHCGEVEDGEAEARNEGAEEDGGGSP